MVNNQKEQITHLEKKILTFFDQVYQQHLLAIEGLTSNSFTKIKQVTKEELKINFSYNSVFKRTIYSLTQYNFYASHLRKVLAYVHIANDLERIGDFANNLCLFLLQIKEKISPQERAVLVFAWRKAIPFFETVKKLFFVQETSQLLDFLQDNKYKKTIFKEFIAKLQAVYQKQSFALTNQSLYFLKQFFSLKRIFEHLENIVEYLLLIASFKTFKLYKKGTT